ISRRDAADTGSHPRAGGEVPQQLTSSAPAYTFEAPACLDGSLQLLGSARLHRADEDREAGEKPALPRNCKRVGSCRLPQFFGLPLWPAPREGWPRSLSQARRPAQSAPSTLSRAKEDAPCFPPFLVLSFQSFLAFRFW